ncbi:MAG: extracellular solute-binding protein [Clostridiales bacterium]|nr:extracellular solute-binding protein [Clostridiales bacterium]
MKRGKFLRALSSGLAASIMALSLGACAPKSTEQSGGPSGNPSAPEAPKPSTGVTDTVPVDLPNNQLAYKGKLSFAHFSSAEEERGGSAEATAMRAVIAEWKKVHTDVNLDENVLANNEYKDKIAALGAANDLPDMFIIQGMNTRQWARQGLLYDLSQPIADSPYAADYHLNKLYPFTGDDGAYYALPALAEGTCSVVLYNKQMWADAGFDKFPDNWDDVISAAQGYFKDNDKDAIAFGNGSKWQINSTFLDVIGDRFTGGDWYKSIIEKKGAKFTDPEFVQALEFTKKIFSPETGVFNGDFNAVTNEDAREYFLAGDAAAFIGGKWDVSYIRTAAEQSGMIDDIGFALIPQPEGATKSFNTHATGQGYGVAISAKTAEDPDKLAAALDLAYQLTGKPFAVYLAQNFAETSFTDPGEVDLSKFNQFTQDYYHFYDNTGCEIYDSYLTGAIWDVMNTGLQEMLNGNKDPQALAAESQKAYEESY